MRDYSRLDQTIFSRARVRELTALVVGAGALGNEVLKNLALVGVGHLVIADRDSVENTNLTRSVLFCTPQIAGHIAARTPKAVVAAEQLRTLNPDVTVTPIVGEVADVGLGFVRAADVVFSCVDNELARLETSWACTRAGRPCVDGGLGNLNPSSGAVALYPAGDGPCYACRKGSDRRRELLWSVQGREDPCWLHEREAEAADVVTTTPVMASIVGALQVEVGLRYVADPVPWAGRGTAWTIALAPQTSLDTRAVERSAGCPLHDDASRIERPIALERTSEDLTVQELLACAGDDATLLLDWPLTARAACRACGHEWEPLVRRARFRRSRCPACGGGDPVEREVIAEVTARSPFAARTLLAFGCPRWHVHELVAAGEGSARVHVEVSGDRPGVFARAVPC
jgi:adenylyltransferase/sulfurtransferase